MALTRPLSRLTAVGLTTLTLMAASGNSFAHSGPRIGVGSAVASPFALNLQAIVPFATIERAGETLTLAARADAAIVPGATPAVGASLMMLGSEEHVLQPYLAIGAGLSFTGAGALLTGYGTTGMHFTISGNWGGFTEAQFSNSEYSSSLQLALGATYTFR